MLTWLLHHIAFHTSFPVYLGGLFAGLVLVAVLYVKPRNVKALLKLLTRRLRNAVITGAAVAVTLVIYVGGFRHAVLVKEAAAWGHGGPAALLVYGGADTFVIVTALTFTWLMFRKKGRGQVADLRDRKTDRRNGRTDRGSGRTDRRRTTAPARNWTRV